MKKTNPQIQITISPSEYSKLNSKQLGNHFMYSKLTTNQKWNDPRLKVLNSHYFIGKSVLDIGCNEGILSIPIAIKFKPKIVHAIDIDLQMIKKAKHNTQIFVKKNQHYQFPKEIIEEISTLPLLLQERLSKRFGEQILQLPNHYEVRPKDIKKQQIFPKNLLFEPINILSDPSFETYDCILCMNVTRWIHLAFGDEGIRQLFSSIQKKSTNGTILIFEFPPWDSYKKKKNMFSTYKENHNQIVYKPENFWTHFKVRGFEIIENIKPNQSNSLKYDIIVMQKKNSH